MQPGSGRRLKKRINDSFPVIIKKQQSEGAQAFTMMHELGHLPATSPREPCRRRRVP
ncbi:ImmA/IrrE family metallo-endopeptidase [Marinobacter sp.]|uniref:ImmA/IrrE family metallo-endopeptidase n=1 Tax=Marinobacter sp. TaxID=50741 RepID=UPI0034A04AC8